MLKDQERIKQEFHCAIYDTEIIVHWCKETNKYFGKTLKLPKKDVGYEWVLSKIEKENIFVSFAPIFSDLIRAQGLKGWCYPASYGIGVESISFYFDREMKKRIEAILVGLGIELIRTEYSNASFVYRYVIAQNAKNIEIIKKIIEKQ